MFQMCHWFVNVAAALAGSAHEKAGRRCVDGRLGSA
jgi:hypothetical protein